MPKKGTGKATGSPVYTAAEKNKFTRFAQAGTSKKAEAYAKAENPGKIYSGKSSWEKQKTQQIESCNNSQESTA